MDESSDTSTQEKPSRKIYYKLRLYPGKWINVLYDRLTLIALLDRWWQLLSLSLLRRWRNLLLRKVTLDPSKVLSCVFYPEIQPFWRTC